MEKQEEFLHLMQNGEQQEQQEEKKEEKQEEQEITKEEANACVNMLLLIWTARQRCQTQLGFLPREILHMITTDVKNSVNKIECENCHKNCLKEEDYEEGQEGQEVYWRPRDKDSKYYEFCSSDCRESFLSEGDFPFQYCEGCDRYVCYRNPSNGYMTQFCEEKCLSCHEEYLLREGQPIYDFKKDYMRGGNWFDEEDLIEAGYVADKAFVSYFANSETCYAYNKHARHLIKKKDCQVITKYGSRSIFGDEGYVTMFVKYPPITTSDPIPTTEMLDSVEPSYKKIKV